MSRFSEYEVDAQRKCPHEIEPSTVYGGMPVPLHMFGHR